MLWEGIRVGFLPRWSCQSVARPCTNLHVPPDLTRTTSMSIQHRSSIWVAAVRRASMSNMVYNPSTTTIQWVGVKGSFDYMIKRGRIGGVCLRISEANRTAQTSDKAEIGKWTERPVAPTTTVCVPRVVHGVELHADGVPATQPDQDCSGCRCAGRNKYWKRRTTKGVLLDAGTPAMARK